MRTATTLLLVLILTVPTLAGDGPYALGDRVADFEGQGLGGTAVKLSDLAITELKAKAAVLEVAKTYAGGASVEATMALSDLKGLHDDEGSFDDELKAELIGSLGRRFGLIATDAQVDAMTTLADLVAWVIAAKDSPIAVVLWSSGCDTCINFYNEKQNEIVAEEGARMLVVASHPYDTVKLIEERLEGFPFHWQVVLDQKQDIKNLFVEGATRTPHVFLLDKEGVLRYRGSIDSDPTIPTGDEELEAYMRDAIRALKAGEKVQVTESQPKGCPLKLARRKAG